MDLPVRTAVLDAPGAAAPTPAHLREVFGAVPTSVVAVCALVDGAPAGMVFSTFVGVSLEPALASVCVSGSSRTWRLLRTARRLGVSVLWGPPRPPSRAGWPATRPTCSPGSTLRMTASGALLLGGAAAWLECAVRTSVPAGDHGLVPLDIHELAAESGTAPLVYWHSGFVGLRD